MKVLTRFRTIEHDAALRENIGVQGVVASSSPSNRMGPMTAMLKPSTSVTNRGRDPVCQRRTDLSWLTSALIVAHPPLLQHACVTTRRAGPDCLTRTTP